MSRKLVQARSWPGSGREGQQPPGRSGSSGQSGCWEPCGGHAQSGAVPGCVVGPHSPRARLLYVETLLLFTFPMYKAKQLVKRHLETAETHSFHVTYFKKR